MDQLETKLAEAIHRNSNLGPKGFGTGEWAGDLRKYLPAFGAAYELAVRVQRAEGQRYQASDVRQALNSILACRGAKFRASLGIVIAAFSAAGGEVSQFDSPREPDALVRLSMGELRSALSDALDEATRQYKARRLVQSDALS